MNDVVHEVDNHKSSTQNKRTMEYHWFPVSTSIVFTIVATIVFTLMVTPINADTVAAVFPPWWDSASVMAAAGRAGAVLDIGRIPATLIVHGERSTLAARLRTAGALIILDAGLAGGCRTRRQDVSR